MNKSTHSMTALLVGMGAGFVLAAGCKVNLDDTVVYACENNADCGGGTYVCTAKPGGVGKCCSPTGEETCDGKDNDCNGIVDDRGIAEICNAIDDNCDGRVDEGIDLQKDSLHCGSCPNSCAPDEMCVSGTCALRSEKSCTDGVDNNLNGKTDCADSECLMQPCDATGACRCLGGKATEVSCNNGVDDDADGTLDCADSDCGGAACGTGCSCRGGVKFEDNCRDTVDNDGDGTTDCQDPGCQNAYCSASPDTSVCVAPVDGGAAGSCKCNPDAGGSQPEPIGMNPLHCGDGIDNDCDGLLDCAEAACNTRACNTDGGCVCTMGTAVETTCGDRRDNDRDGYSDCQDSLPDGGGDCPTGTACTRLVQGVVTAGSCQRLVDVDAGTSVGLCQ